MSKGWKTFAIWCTLILLFFAFFSFFRNQPRSDPWRTTQAFTAALEASGIRAPLYLTQNDGTVRAAAVHEQTTAKRRCSRSCDDQL